MVGVDDGLLVVGLWCVVWGVGWFWWIVWLLFVLDGFVWLVWGWWWLGGVIWWGGYCDRLVWFVFDIGDFVIRGFVFVWEIGWWICFDRCCFVFFVELDVGWKDWLFIDVYL